MNAQFKKLLKTYSIMFLISIFLSFVMKYLNAPNIIYTVLLIYTILLILFATVLLLSKAQKDKFQLLSVIISIVINVLNFINTLNKLM